LAQNVEGLAIGISRAYTNGRSGEDKYSHGISTIVGKVCA